MEMRLFIVGNILIPRRRSMVVLIVDSLGKMVDALGFLQSVGGARWESSEPCLKVTISIIG